MSKYYVIAAILLMATPATAKQPIVEGTLDSHLGKPMMEMHQVFSGQRFPNVVVTLDGTVLTTWGNKNVQARRSEDGGKTWQAPITIADPGFQGGGTTVDEGTGDILTFVEEHHPPAKIALFRSTSSLDWTLRLIKIEKVLHVPIKQREFDKFVMLKN